MILKPSTALPWVVNTQTWKSRISDHTWSACGIEQDEAVHGEMASAICYAQSTGQLLPKDAAYIVQACNAFPALVEIAKEVLESHAGNEDLRAHARAALAQAGVEHD